MKSFLCVLGCSVGDLDLRFFNTVLLPYLIICSCFTSSSVNLILEGIHPVLTIYAPMIYTVPWLSWRSFLPQGRLEPLLSWLSLAVFANCSWPSSRWGEGPFSPLCEGLAGPVPKFIDPVFAKTSPKRSFFMTVNERFGLAFTKTRPVNSGTSLCSPPPLCRPHFMIFPTLQAAQT